MKTSRDYYCARVAPIEQVENDGIYGQSLRDSHVHVLRTIERNCSDRDFWTLSENEWCFVGSAECPPQDVGIFRIVDSEGNNGCILLMDELTRCHSLPATNAERVLEKLDNMNEKTIFIRGRVITVGWRCTAWPQSNRVDVQSGNGGSFNCSTADTSIVIMHMITEKRVGRVCLSQALNRFLFFTCSCGDRPCHCSLATTMDIRQRESSNRL